MYLDEFLDRLENVRPAGSDYSARCPAHEDRRNSLSISDGGDRILIYCHAMCTAKEVIKEMGLGLSDLYYDRPSKDHQWTWKYDYQEQPEAVYDYTDEKGMLVYQVMRFPGKKFRQRRPSPEGWVWNMDGVKKIPYELPRLVHPTTEEIWITEGEKDANALNQIFDLLNEDIETATCFVGGAGRGKFLARYVKYFVNKYVLIIADKDEPGLAYAREIEDALTGVAASVKVVQAAVGKDVSDHLDAGKTLDELEEVASEQQ